MRVGKAGELYMNGDAADGRRHADARRVRARAVGQHRPARAHVPREHEEERLRARRDAQILDVADARARPRRAHARLRRRARRADQLSGAEPGRSAWCCRRTRRACTRCGCRSFRCRSAWCSSPARRSRGRRIAWRRRSFRPAFRAKRSRSIPAAATSAPRCSTVAAASLIFGGTATVERYKGNPARPGPRPGLLARSCSATTRSISWEKVSRRDGRQRLRQQRPRLHQLLGHLGCRHTQEIADALAERLAADRAAAAGRSRGRPGGVHGAGRGRSHLAGDRRGPAGAGRHRRDREVSRRQPRSIKQGRARLPAADGRPLRDRRTPRSRRRNTCSRSSTVVECPEIKMLEQIGPTLVCTRHHLQRRQFRRQLLDAMHIDRLNIGPMPTIAAELAAAARRQHRRLPVPRAGVSDGDLLACAGVVE